MLEGEGERERETALREAPPSGVFGAPQGLTRLHLFLGLTPNQASLWAPLLLWRPLFHLHSVPLRSPFPAPSKLGGLSRPNAFKCS